MQIYFVLRLPYLCGGGQISWNNNGRYNVKTKGQGPCRDDEGSSLTFRDPDWVHPDNDR